MKKKVNKQFYIEPKLVRQIALLAAEQGTTQSSLIERAMRIYVLLSHSGAKLTMTHEDGREERIVLV